LQRRSTDQCAGGLCHLREDPVLNASFFKTTLTSPRNPMRSLLARRTLHFLGAALAVGLVLALGTDASAGTTSDAQTMVYRGQLQQNGAPFTGLANMSFDFVDAQGNCLEGSPVCAAQPIPVFVLNGEFSADLLLPPTVLQSQSPTIQVTVNGTPLQGTQRIYPVPFAQRGRTQGPFVAEEEVDVVNTDAGVTEVSVGATGSGANGRKIAFAQQPGDDSAAGTIAYYPDYGAGTQGYLDLVGAGTYPNRQVHVADNLSVTQDVNVGRTATMGTATMGSASVTGNLGVGGYLNISGSGGNTPHACVMRANNPTGCLVNGTEGCLSTCVVACAAGEVAVGGGAVCNPSGWFLQGSIPWSFTRNGPFGGPAYGDVATGWSAQCMVAGTNEFAECPTWVWAICCKI
jgi:hypothetical protein